MEVLNNKIIVIFIDEDWDHKPLGYTRKRMLLAFWQVAKQRGYKIVLINRPFCLLTGWTERSHLIHKIGKCLSTEEGIKLIYPIGVHEQILVLFPWMKTFITKQIKKLLLKHIGCEPYACMLFHPYQSYLLDVFPNSKLIYECYDDYTALHSSNVNVRLFDLEKSILTKADIIITTSEELKSDRLKYRKDIWCLPNGVDYEMYENCKNIEQQLLNEKIKIGFVGKLNSKIDFKLLIGIATLRPNWLFYMLGPWDENSDQVPKANDSTRQNNIIYTGLIEYEKLPQWVNGFDAVIVPYVCNNKTYGIFPLKCYEYLAAGKPVVSTRFSEYDKDGLVYYCESNPETFADTIETVIKCNDTAIINKRRDAAKRHTWLKRAEEMLSIISMGNIR